ncbi:MAG TPA: HU family DNA-binding protein [Methylocystis sp.]|nr:HU family DNA-binding protein [Methylocystis sp.]
MSAFGNGKIASTGRSAEGAEDADEEGAAGALTRHAIVLVASASLTHLSRREIRRLVDGVLELMAETLIAGETVKLHDFGSFAVRLKGRRSGRNLQNGERVPIEPRRVVVFKASPRLKRAINGTPPARRPGPAKG